MKFPSLLPLAFATLFSAAFLLTGCSSRRGNDAFDTSLPDPKQAPRPAMVAEDTFFDGKLLVEATIGRGFRPRLKKYMRSGSGGEHATRMDPMGSVLRDEELVNEDEYFIPRMRNSTLPPVALRLRLTNQDAQPLEIQFVECRSYLGNFAVRPEKVTLAPGDAGQPDPMTSLLGVTGDEIPLTIGLRLGGKLETKVLTLRIVKPGTTPAATPAKP